MELFLARLNIMVATSIFDNSNEDPFEILNSNYTSTNSNAMQLIADTGIILRRFIIGAGVIMFIACLITILFIRNNEKLYDEKKSQIIKIFVIILLASSAVTIFTLLDSFIKGVF